MSIARMEKLTVIGLSKDRESLMGELMRLGVVQITAQDAKLTDDEWKSMVSLDGNEEAAAKWEVQIARATQALDTIRKFSTAKKPLIKTRLAVRQRDFDRVMERESEIRKKADYVVKLSEQLTEIKNNTNKVESTKLSLLPWAAYQLPLEFVETKSVQIALGILPAAADTARMEQRFTEVVPETHMEVIAEDSEQHYLSLFYFKGVEDEVNEVLREFGFNRVAFAGMSGSVTDNIAACDAKLAELAEAEIQMGKAVRLEEQYEADLEFYHDGLIMKRDQARIRNKLLVTDKAFYLEGWVPRMVVDRVEMLLRVKECYYEASVPKKDEATPVMLLNGSFSSPFESITKLYAFPDSKGIDATPFFSFSFALFFGMMLADAAYGVIIAVATFLVMKKFRLEGMMKKLINTFFFCGLSAIFWGVMFGGYFGDIIAKVSLTFFGQQISIAPVWFDPLKEPMVLLIFSFALGVVHLYLGMGLSAYMSIRDGRPLDALFDIGLWYLLQTGMILLVIALLSDILPPGIAEAGKWMTIVGFVGILLTAGRSKKGIGGKLVGSLASLYSGVTGFLSDVLSYSRLLALGLAGTVIASVINTLGTLPGSGVAGAIALAVIFIIGHTYNLAISGLGAFVHSCRLEYVEFFGKFYESGGDEFQPFCENTKYIQIIREEK